MTQHAMRHEFHAQMNFELQQALYDEIREANQDIGFLPSTLVVECPYCHFELEVPTTRVLENRFFTCSVCAVRFQSGMDGKPVDLLRHEPSRGFESCLPRSGPSATESKHRGVRRATAAMMLAAAVAFVLMQRNHTETASGEQTVSPVSDQQSPS